MWRVFLVACGGMLGSVLRYLASGWVQTWANTTFPLGTLAVNVAGSFALGLIATLSFQRGWIGPDLRVFLAVGLCGGFTTMSAFSYETLVLLMEGSTAHAVANMALTLLACLGGVWSGTALGRLI